MHIQNRYDALVEKHRRIEAQLAAEMKRPLPNSFILQRLKRKKLRVRDEIASWERLLAEARLRPVLRTSTTHA